MSGRLAAWRVLQLNGRPQKVSRDRLPLLVSHEEVAREDSTRVLVWLGFTLCDHILKLCELQGRRIVPEGTSWHGGG